MKIRFNELLYYEKHPPTGKSIFNDSTVLDLELVKEEITYHVKCHIILEYTRWFYPETFWGPKEDECEIKHFIIETIKGHKYVKEQEIKLTEKELRKLQSQIESELIFE